MAIQSEVTFYAAFETSRRLVGPWYLGAATATEKFYEALVAPTDGSAFVFSRLLRQVEGLTVRTREDQQELSWVFEP